MEQEVPNGKEATGVTMDRPQRFLKMWGSEPLILILIKMKPLHSSVGAIIVSTIMSLIPFLPALAMEEQAQPGKALFQQYCQDCHGPQRDGRGVLRPFLEQDPANLTSQMTQAKTDQELFSIIKRGGGEMHGWADTFTDEQVLDLVQYIRALSP